MGSLFGGGGYDAPEVPEVEPMPSSEEKEPVGKAVREEERRRIRARRGMSGTLLTSPLGTTGGSRSGGLLGRV
ncbi:MAG: hypothetical protein IJU37_11100 [Desulfovibrio sp.]|nr:hypothetical protein [Desulfovibrio sp.]